MTECNSKSHLQFNPRFPIDVEFSADDISSDAGALLLRQAEDRLGICARIASLIPDERAPGRVLHSREEQVRQRVLQIGLGYEDCNDAHWLRGDPLLKAACDLAPEDAHLSSQPTLCRLENAPEKQHVEAMEWAVLLEWVDSLDPERVAITIDFDSTGFEGHGQQQELHFNGFHDAHILHPLLAFDGETGQLICAVLRPGNVGDARGVEELATRLVVLIKSLHRRDCSVLIRADAGFGRPELYRELEQLDQVWGGVSYLIGIGRNSVLQRQLEPALEVARRQQGANGSSSRVFDGFTYKAGSWKRPRHIIGKAEVSALGDNPRFVVTNLDDFDERLLYERGYCRRGECEQRIEEFKCHLRADRISCHRFVANAFRLILHTLAYRLLFELRRVLGEQAALEPASTQLGGRLRWLARATFETLRLRLFKVAVLVRRSARRLFVQGARSFPLADVFHHVAQAMR